MSDILVLQSNNRVVVIEDTLTAVAGGYMGSTETMYPNAAFPDAVSLFKNVTVPSDIVVGVNYNYVGNAFVPSGVSPPTPPAPDIWINKAGIATNRFIAIYTAAVTPAGWVRFKTDPAASWVYDMVMKSDIMDPNDKDGAFRQGIGYLTTTNGADGKVLLTGPQLVQINAAYPNKGM